MRSTIFIIGILLLITIFCQIFNVITLSKTQNTIFYTVFIILMLSLLFLKRKTSEHTKH